jgi:hypothetical protein
MKNLSTGTGLALLASAIVAYPFASSLAPNANAVGIGPTTVSAVAAAATAQDPPAPTIVWYGIQPANGYPNQTNGALFRAWSDGRVETRVYVYGQSGCALSSCGWQVFSDPAQGLTFDADLNFDEAVDGVDLGMMLAKWGPAPRNPVPPSDCPLALINP